MTMCRLTLLLLSCVMCSAQISQKTAEEVEQLNRVKRLIQNDEPDQISTTTISPENRVIMDLTPVGPVTVTEGDDLTIHCKIRNKPPGSAIQWYYIVRGDDGTFENFTIIGNEEATVDVDKYQVSTLPPNINTFRVRYFHINDTGEYCCFLYVSYHEAYRQSTQIIVTSKPVEPTRPIPVAMPVVGGSTRRRSRQGQIERENALGSIARDSDEDSSSREDVYDKDSQVDSAVDDMVDETLKLDIQTELVRRLNSTYEIADARTRQMIQNATEQIESLLKSSDQMTSSTRKSPGKDVNNIKSQVKTVVSNLFSSVSNVNATLSQATATILSRVMLAKKERQRRPEPTDSPGDSSSEEVDDWRKLYDDYKKSRGSTAAAAETEERSQSHRSGAPAPHRVDEVRPTHSNRLSPSLLTPTTTDDDDEWERREEESNTLINEPDTKRHTPKCQYQLVVNEFDPSQCPSINNPQPAAAYYRSEPAVQDDSREIPSARMPHDQITRLENKLLDEMVNTKVVNKTVNMHDELLTMTEQKLKEQTSNLEKVEDMLSKLTADLKQQHLAKRSMDEKIKGVMLNIVEVNKRLDTAMSRKPGQGYNKEVQVVGSAVNNNCDRHANVTYHKDCDEVAEAGNINSGVYYIKPIYASCPIPVWCDLDTYPGGWTVLQRREKGDVNFERGWIDYRNGFGNVTGDHWLGNDNIFMLSNQDEYMMRVDLWDFFDSRVYAEYRVFKLDGERDGFRLIVDQYSGTAGDGLKTHNNQKFSTIDKDHDQWDDYHCGYEWGGGWWFTNCWSTYLNGPYYNVSNPPYNGISWREWKEEQLARSEIKIRPVYHLQKPILPEEPEEPEETETEEFTTDEEVTGEDNSNIEMSDQPMPGRHHNTRAMKRRPMHFQ